MALLKGWTVTSYGHETITSYHDEEFNISATVWGVGLVSVYRQGRQIASLCMPDVTSALHIADEIVRGYTGETR